MKKLKRFAIVFFLFIAAFAVYVEIANRNSKNMTYRQKILKAVYPVLMWASRFTGKNLQKHSNDTVRPPVPFYSLKGKLLVIGFPANDFKEQEKGTDEEIMQFCKLNYGVTFPLMKKSVVIRSAGQNPVFQWLTDSAKNGWNNKYPSWNFSKYLVNENGILTNYFDPSVSPLGKEIREAIEKK